MESVGAALCQGRQSQQATRIGSFRIVMLGAVTFFFAVLLLSPAGAAAESTLTGVLYSDFGGVSATATGRVQLCVAGRIRSFRYQRPFLTRSPSAEDNRDANVIGAIWQVQLRPHRGTLRIASAHYTGHNAPIRSSAELIRQLVSLLREEKYAKAQGLLAKQSQADRSFKSFVAEFTPVVSASQWNVGCVAVLSASNAEVNLAVDRFCVRQGGYGTLRFTLVPQQREWRIASIRFVKEDIWDLLPQVGSVCGGRQAAQ